MPLKNLFLFSFLLILNFVGYAQKRAPKLDGNYTKSTTISINHDMATVQMVFPVPTPIGEPVEIKNRSARHYSTAFDALVAQGYRPIKVEVKQLNVIDFTDGEKPRLGYWATLQKYQNDYAWVARHALSAEKYQQEFDIWTQQGYMPTSIGLGAVRGGEEAYSVIFEKVPNAPAWVARHGLSSDAFNTENEALLKQGYKLKCQVSCIKYINPIYAAIWVK